MGNVAIEFDEDGLIVKYSPKLKLGVSRKGCAFLEMHLRIQRDSVCMGDDMLSHELEIVFNETISLSELVQLIIQNNSLPRIKYLPTISGDKATWVLTYNYRPLAVMAQEWEIPKYLVDKDERLLSFIDFGSHKPIEFQYLAQTDPQMVFERLEQAIQYKSHFDKKIRLMNLISSEC